MLASARRRLAVRLLVPQGGIVMKQFGLPRRASIFVVTSLAVVSLLSIAAAYSASAPAAAPKRIDDFLGLWLGVDSLDGAEVILSLSDINDDGIIELTQSEHFYSFCHAMGANFNLGRGVEVGTATVAKTKDALDVDIQLTCIDDGNGQHPRDPVSIQYLLRSRGRFLVVPEFEFAPAIVLHRISS
jgi:hypothetical protein